MHLLRLILIPLFFNVLMPSGFGQTQEAKLCKVTITVSVLHEGSLVTVPGLSRSSFSLSAGKVRTSPVSAELVRAKRVIILLDKSGSMREPWPTVSRIVRELLSDIPPNIDVIAYSFAEELSKIGPRDATLGFLDSAEKDLRNRVKGKTRFYESLNQVALRENADADSVIAVISDGDNDVGGLNQKQLEQEFARRSARLVFIFLQSHSAPITAEQEHDMTLLPYVIKDTGAIAILIPDVEGVLDRTLPADIADALLNSYRLEFEDSSLANRKIDLEIVGPNAKKVKKIEVHRVARMPACR